MALDARRVGAIRLYVQQATRPGRRWPTVDNVRRTGPPGGVAEHLLRQVRRMCARADGEHPSALVRAVVRLDVVVEVELSAAVRLALARFASASCEPLTSAFPGPVIRLRSVRTGPDRSGC